MTNNLSEIKTRAKGFSSRSLALVLCFVMLLTAIGSGSVLSAIAAGFDKTDAAVLADAAKIGAVVTAAEDADTDEAVEDASGDIAAEDTAEDSAAGSLTVTKKADTDLADTGANNPTTLYVCLPKTWTENSYTNDIWLRANTDNGWINSTSASDTGKTHHGYRIYSFVLSSGSYDGWSNIWLKGKSSASSDHDSDYSAQLQIVNTWHGSANTGGKINYTAVSGTINDWGSEQTFTKYDTEYYLSGWIGKNGTSSADTNQGSADFKMTQGSGSNSNKWTCTYTVNGDQYFTVNMKDGWNNYYALHPANDNAGSGTVWNTVDQKYSGSGNNKWKATASAGTTITVTYDTWTHKLSWETVESSYYLTGWLNGAAYTGTAYKFSGSGDSYTYTFSSTTAAQYLTITDSAGKTYHPASHPAANGAVYSTTDTSPNADPKWGITSGAKDKKITFTWKPTSKTLSWTVGTVTTVDIYAKDGVAPINWDDKTKNGATDLGGYNENNTTNYFYGFGRIATTTLGGNATGINTVKEGYKNISDSNSWYQTAKADTGKTITVTTTIDGLSGKNWSTRYYVVGWSVNGVTYKEGTDTVGVNNNPGASKTTYSFTYTIPDADSLPTDVKGNPVVEITPIFYLQSKTNIVTFYLEGYTDVQSKWGNTPYVYPFYGNLNGYQNTYGTYPGQPMVNVGGQYSIEVPINATAIDSSKQPSSTVIKGVTISNGYADHVHRNLIYGWTTGSDVGNDKDHMQTYDYDDFYKIYEERLVSGQHPNAIFFRIKERTTKYNRSTYGGSSATGQFASGTSSINISTIANNGNGWELLKDRHDRNVNIFGDYSAVSSITPSSATADTSNAIYVVSTGYNANIAGDYGTMWKIYNGSGSLISKDTSNGRYGIPPSLLNLRGTSSGYDSTGISYASASHSVAGVGSYTDSNAKYESIYKTLKSTYANKIVYITYEKDTQDTRDVTTGTGAYRLDGKWFYTHASDTVKSTVGIEYYDKSSGKWIADTVNASTGKGTTTKATVQFDSDSYASSSNITTSKDTLTGSATTLNFTASESGEGYAFDGWFLQYDSTYDPVTGATNKGSIKSTANYKLVARYIPVVTGSLTVSYKLDPTSTGTKDTMSLSVKYGTQNAVAGTLGDDGVYRATITGLTHTTTATNIVVTLKAKPKYDGKVTAFGDDGKIASYTAQSSPSLPGGENAEITKTYTLTNNDLYSEEDHTNQLITDLEYTTKIEATPHYYEFTYKFNDRGGAEKTYTSRGEISAENYTEYVNGTSISDNFVKSRAPFESNFLKTLKLGTISKGYTSGTHTFTASATYSATKSTPIFDIKIKLPYDYYTTSGTASGVSYKKYNASSDAYNASKAAFTLKAKYDEYVTIDASETASGTQTKLNKVLDVKDVNHTGNYFITAPDKLGSKYFRYWEIKRLADSDAAQATAPAISKIYFPDLNYRFYTDCYVEAVYTDNEAEFWSNVNQNGTNDDISCSVIYLDSSRNQWNTVASGNSTNATVAADMIYNDFMFSYRLGDTEYISSEEAEIGLVVERVYYTQDGTNSWAKGDSTVTDMDSYKSSYSDTEAARKTMIENYLKGTSTTFTGCVKQVWKNDELVNKNYTEQNYMIYSQYGQTVGDHSISFATDSSVDEYVYRAWAYMKTADDTVVVSDDPAYFSMNFVATQNYSE